MKYPLIFAATALCAVSYAQSGWWTDHTELTEVMLEAQAHSATRLALMAGTDDLETFEIQTFLDTDSRYFVIESVGGASYLNRNLHMQLIGSYDPDTDLYNWTTNTIWGEDSYNGTGWLKFDRFRGDDVKSSSEEKIGDESGTVSSKEYKERKDKNGNPTGFVDSKGTFHYKKKYYDYETKTYKYRDTFEQVNDDYEAGKGCGKWKFGKSAGTFGVSLNITNPSWNGPGYGSVDIGETVVPEPATVGALGIGAAALLRKRRK